MTGRAGLRRWRASKWVCKNTIHTHTDVLCTRELAGGNTRGKRTELHSCRCSRSRGSASCRFFRQHRMLCHGSWTGLHSAVVSLELHLLCPNTALGQAWVHVCTSVAGKRGRTVTAPRSDCRANALAPSLTVHRLRTLPRLKAPSTDGLDSTPRPEPDLGQLVNVWGVPYSVMNCGVQQRPKAAQVHGRVREGCVGHTEGS